MIIDSHAHYDDEAFAEDREMLLNEMAKNSIEYIINVGSELATCKSTMELVERYSYIYGAIGIHPNAPDELTEEDYRWITELCAHRKVVAVGEIGLDYYWDEPARDIQKDRFRRQLHIAKITKLPVIIHSRDAAQDTLEIMKENNADQIGGVMHCFSYSKEIAAQVLDMGFSIGIGGVITFKNARKMVEVVEETPIERILLETDCPYLAPEPFRGKRNTSLNLPLVAAKIAQIKGITQDEVERITAENAKKLYRIP